MKKQKKSDLTQSVWQTLVIEIKTYDDVDMGIGVHLYAIGESVN